jgi:hypothetical protein
MGLGTSPIGSLFTIWQGLNGELYQGTNWIFFYGMDDFYLHEFSQKGERHATDHY